MLRRSCPTGDFLLTLPSPNARPHPRNELVIARESDFAAHRRVRAFQQSIAPSKRFLNTLSHDAPMEVRVNFFEVLDKRNYIRTSRTSAKSKYIRPESTVFARAREQILKKKTCRVGTGHVLSSETPRLAELLGPSGPGKRENLVLQDEKTATQT